MFLIIVFPLKVTFVEVSANGLSSAVLHSISVYPVKRISESPCIPIICHVILWLGIKVVVCLVKLRLLNAKNIVLLQFSAFIISMSYTSRTEGFEPPYCNQTPIRFLSLHNFVTCFVTIEKSIHRAKPIPFFTCTCSLVPGWDAGRYMYMYVTPPLLGNTEH